VMAESLVSFLGESKKQFLWKTNESYHVIFGNQACDLDSMVSAITLAYFEYKRDNNSNRHVPLIPIKRSEFNFRTEAVFLFKKFAVPTESLLFIDDFDLNRLLSATITLLDHNLPTGPFETCSPNVTHIVDHHEDMKGVFPKLENKQIEMVGCCSTLVAEKFINSGAPFLENDPVLCHVFLATILLDTIDLNPAMGKVTPKDHSIALSLQKILSKNSSVVFGEIFSEIQTAKNDCAVLTTAELLAKDFKEWKIGNTKYGFCSVLLSLEIWLERNDLIPNFLKFSDENGLDLLIVMTAYTNSEKQFCREIVVYEKTEVMGSKIVAEMENQKEILDIVPFVNERTKEITKNGDVNVWFFHQKNIKSSRKQVQPLVHSLVQNLSKM